MGCPTQRGFPRHFFQGTLDSSPTSPWTDETRRRNGWGGEHRRQGDGRSPTLRCVMLNLSEHGGPPYQKSVATCCLDVGRRGRKLREIGEGGLCKPHNGTRTRSIWHVEELRLYA